MDINKCHLPVSKGGNTYKELESLAHDLGLSLITYDTKKKLCAQLKQMLNPMASRRQVRVDLEALAASLGLDDPGRYGTEELQDVVSFLLAGEIRSSSSSSKPKVSKSVVDYDSDVDSNDEYRCPHETLQRFAECDGKNDPITYEPIHMNCGVCLGERCYSAGTINNVRKDPMTRRVLTASEKATTKRITKKCKKEKNQRRSNSLYKTD